MEDFQIRGLIEKALESKFGIVVKTSNLRAFQQKYYRVRKKMQESGTPVPLSLRHSPADRESEMWLVKEQPDEQEEAPPNEEGDDAPV